MSDRLCPGCNVKIVRGDPSLAPCAICKRVYHQISDAKRWRIWRILLQLMLAVTLISNFSLFVKPCSGLSRSCYHMCCCQPKLQKILHLLASLHQIRLSLTTPGSSLICANCSAFLNAVSSAVRARKATVAAPPPATPTLPISPAIDTAAHSAAPADSQHSLKRRASTPSPSVTPSSKT